MAAAPSLVKGYERERPNSPVPSPGNVFRTDPRSTTTKEFREIIVMRELEGMGYKAIAEVAGVPLGTVMSRLARARKRLQRSLIAALPKRP